MPDWVEYLASGAVMGVDPAGDRDSDGIPDYAERLVCGTDTCSTGREDVDGDGVRDWAEVVICGDTTCATGGEDYDGDGVPDHEQLQACVVYDRSTWWDRASKLATTGWGPWLIALLGVAAVAGGWGLVRRARAIQAARELEGGTAAEAEDGELALVGSGAVADAVGASVSGGRAGSGATGSGGSSAGEGSAWEPVAGDHDGRGAAGSTPEVTDAASDAEA